jgi:RES domain-containing protein
MDVYRVHGRRYDPLDGTGAAAVGGRWNPIGSPVVYACRTFEGALLEQLVHASTGRLPSNRVGTRLAIPEKLSVHTFDVATHADWTREGVSQQIGRAWLARGEAVALLVPSVVAQPWGWNVLLNPLHEGFGELVVAETVEVAWDPRLRRVVR